MQSFPVRCLIVCLGVWLATPSLTATVTAADRRTGIPRYDAAVDNAVAYLKSGTRAISPGQLPLVAYALLKSGEPKDSGIVADGIQMARQRAAAGDYQGYEHIYQAGVDAMLLADSDPDAHFEELQKIANYLQSTQHSTGYWTEPGNNEPGDVSMTQYGVLGLWAAQRAGCTVSAQAFDRAAAFHLASGNPDGGWGYRPGTSEGPGRGASTHNMTLAGAGSVSVARSLLHGPKNFQRKSADEDKPLYGVLEKVPTEAEKSERTGTSFPEYRPNNAAGTLDSRVDRALAWNQTRLQPISREAHKIYFYYTLERAAALNDMQGDWFTLYGDGLLTLQSEDGSFATFAGQNVGTSFALLYFMRSTDQILRKQFGGGGQRGNRDLQAFMNPDAKNKKKEIGPLDELLSALEDQDFASLDVDATDIVEKIEYGSKEELVGQIETLKKLLKHPDAENRKVAYWALGRTGDFALVPQMLEGLRDPHVGVNAEALAALRYISRKPNGFDLPLDPLAGLEPGASEDRRVEVANKWRTQAYNTWSDWYFRVRPYSERDGLDELLRRIP